MPWLCTIQNTSNSLAKTHFRTNNHYEGRKTTLSLLHTFTLTFSFRFLQTSLIIKDLIKHDNKFNRKDFHDRENSENWFSEFSYFMKGFKKYIMNISCSLHNETIVKYVFHEMLWKKYFTLYPHLKTNHWISKNFMIICLKSISEKCFLFNVNVNASLMFFWALGGLLEDTQTLGQSEGT